MFFKDFVSVKRQKIKRGASQTYDTPSSPVEYLKQGNMAATRFASKTRIYLDVKQMLDITIGVVKNFPKSQRPIFGDRLCNMLIDNRSIQLRKRYNIDMKYKNMANEILNHKTEERKDIPTENEISKMLDEGYELEMYIIDGRIHVECYPRDS